MRRPYLLLVVPVLVLILSGKRTRAASPLQDCCHSSSPSRPPGGAAAVAPMGPVDTDAVRTQFNHSSDKVRIVALLSPSCSACRSGHAVIGQILKKFPSPKLQAILIWEPMKEADSAAAASKQASAIDDTRLVQGWNGNKAVGELFAKTLDLHEIAWDVYLIYKPGVKWDAGQPPRPTFWMHQLESADPNLLLCENPTRLGSEVGKLLEQPN